MDYSNTLWKIETVSNGTITARYGTEDLHNMTDGQTSRFLFNFPSKGENLVVPSGETYTVESATEEIYYSADIDGTLNVNGTLTLTAGTFEQLQEYEQEADNFVRHTTESNNHKYTLQLPSNSSIDSLLVGIQPSQDLQDKNVEGLWGLITGGTDNRNNALTNYDYELEVWKLADYNEYSDTTAVANDLEV